MMNMPPGGRLAGVGGRRRHTPMIANRGIAERQSPVVALGRFRRDAQDGRGGLRQQSDAKQQLGETAAEHEAGDPELFIC
jgi:hypothetical protein